MKWCSCIVCNWCLSLDIASILALRVEHVGAWKSRTHHWHNPSEGYLEAYIIPFSNLSHESDETLKAKLKTNEGSSVTAIKNQYYLGNEFLCFNYPDKSQG